MNKRATIYVIAFGAALAAFLVYLPALRNGFVVWDDDFYVYNNVHLRSFNAEFLRWACSYSTSVGFWHPLTWLSHAADYALWGLNPAGHHFTSILLHGVNTFIIIVLAAGLLEEAKLDRRSVLIAAGVTGALFGVHPLRVESVAWVAERKDLLYSFFYLLSIGAYLSHTRELRQRVSSSAFPLTKQYFLSLILFVFSVASKPMAVTLPAVLILLDWYPLGRSDSWKRFARSLPEKIPFLAVSLATSAVTIMAQRAVGAMAPLDVVPLWTRPLLACHGLMQYLGKLALPVHLLPLYPLERNISLFSPEFFASVVLTLGISFWCVREAGKHRIWPAVWGYFVVTLFPVLGFFQSGLHSMADRFTYLPGVGPFLIAGLGAARVWEFTESRKGEHVGRKSFVIMAASAVMILLVASTVKQIGLWKDSISLWSSVIEREPDKVPLAYNNRGVAFRANGQFDRALKDYDAAIDLAPFDARIYTNRGIVYGEMGLSDRAIDDLNRAIALDPAYSDAYTSRGLVYARTGNLQQALQDYDRAIELNSLNADAYLNRGVAYERMGQFVSAYADYDRAITLDPADHLAYNSRGKMQEKLGRMDEAVADQTSALSLKPDFAQAYQDRGSLYLQTGQRELALKDFRAACDLGSESACSALRR